MQLGVWKMKNMEPTKEKLTKKGARIITYETKNASRLDVVCNFADSAASIEKVIRKT